MPDDPELSIDGASLRSVAWHCVQCGAYRIYDDATMQPAACSSCGSSELASASPTRSRLLTGFDSFETFDPVP
jgi:hypothetical protein